MYSSNEEVYSEVKLIIEHLNSNNDETSAQKLEDALYSGCTSGEVLGDLLIVFSYLKKENKIQDKIYIKKIDNISRALKKALK